MSSIFDLEEKDQVFIVNLHLPQIDMFNVTELLEDFKVLVERTPANIVLNLAETSFVDSSGMGGLIRIHQQIKAYEGQFYIANLNGKVANLMRITRSSQYLNCFDTMDEALKAIKKAAPGS
jgi:anti-anti-sigma factor